MFITNFYMFVNWAETFAKVPLAKQIVGKTTHYQQQERGLCIYFFKQYCVHLLVKKSLNWNSSTIYLLILLSQGK